jgi:hypothetical protein
MMTLVKDQLSHNITHTEKYYTVNKNLSSQVSFQNFERLGISMAYSSAVRNFFTISVVL